MRIPKYNSGTITTTQNIGSGHSRIWATSHRVEDDLQIVLEGCPTGYTLDIKLRGRALALANSVARGSPWQEGASIRLADYDEAAKVLSTYSMTLAVGSNHFLEPKYGTVAAIRYEGIGDLHDGMGSLDPERLKLPPGFVSDMFAGFGFHWELRIIVRELERAGKFTELVLREDPDCSINGSVVRLTYEVFDKWRRAIKRGHDRALQFGNGAKIAFLRNELGRELHIPSASGSSVRDPVELANGVFHALQLPGRRPPIGETSDVVRALRNAGRIGQGTQRDLLALKDEIELLTLEDLIKRLREHLQKRHNENFWQKFLSDNSFILRLAFNLPIAVFGEQISVGGMKFSGTGGKIADYLLHAGAFGNMAIIEIKTPDTQLVSNKEYRGGVYAPHPQIAGAVTQVLDQRYQLQMEINNKKVASQRFDVFTYAMPGLIIAGSDLEDADHRKSFELFRNGLKDVTIVTFSELLDKLVALHDFLSAGQSSSTAQS